MTDERPLDPFLDAAVAEADRAATRPPPSFAAVLARAHSLAPDAVPPPAAAPALTALPTGHAPSAMSSRPFTGRDTAGHDVLPSGPAGSAASTPGHAPRDMSSSASSGPGPAPSGHAPSAMSSESSGDPHTAALAPFLTAARGLADADVAVRLRRPPPPLPRPRPRIAPLLLAAAAVLLLLAVPGALRRLADRTDGSLTGAQADDTVRHGPQEHRPDLRAPSQNVSKDMPPTTSPEGHVPEAISPSLAGQALEAPADSPARADDTIPPSSEPPAGSARREPPSADSRPASPVPPTSPRPDPLAAELARLDDEAEALLLAGALDDADARYQQMIAIGGRRPAVEHAYADRWLLARRRGDDDGHRELLRAYLKKFPRGRFADEASAGLCRLADADARPDCWRDYSDRFPGGAYRREAEEATAP
ncbi:hypothetical protein [Nannocystis sp. SCPEA4]|uniref:hypothetical protein n=1 Tax=Nannocystis sp. SCPEA4 TaxID=2996787 RepID=UPI00226F895D|nr:hypothetical protein [Nannocystis sp. SCPEA4]MCY1054497.1 hypothetical protein [Nannocystis sp. SCPEA4]